MVERSLRMREIPGSKADPPKHIVVSTPSSTTIPIHWYWYSINNNKHNNSNRLSVQIL